MEFKLDSMFSENAEDTTNKTETSLTNNTEKSLVTSSNIRQNSNKKPNWGANDNLSRSLQSIIEDINKKRKQDEILLDDFKNALEAQMSKTYRAVENALFEQYETTNDLMQSKIQELSKVMDRINMLENEFMEFHQALKSLFQDL